MHGFCHREIPTTDARKSAAFYQEVFGWEINESDPNYIQFATPDNEGGGFTSVSKPTTDGIILYIQVEDIDEKLPAAFGEQINHVPDYGHYEQGRGHAMDHAPELEAALPAEQKLDPPGLGETKRKTGYHQHYKSNGQEDMLPQFVVGHAANLSLMKHFLDLLAQVEKPVDDHGTDNQDDGYDIYIGDYIRYRR